MIQRRLLLLWAKTGYRPIALIHQRLYKHENLAAIDLGGFLQDLLRQVSSVFKKPGTDIQMESNVPETLLDIDTAVPPWTDPE